MAQRKLRKSVGIIIPSITAQFRDNFLDTLTKNFMDRGYQTTISLTGGNVETERMYFKSVATHSDCLIVLSSAEKYSEIKDVVPRNVPILFLFHMPDDCPLTCILENDYSAIYQGIISLANRNAQNIAFVCTHFDKTFSQSCYKAYTDALKAVLPNSIREDLIYDIENTWSFNPRKLIDELINKHCDAIFCTSSALTGSILDSMMFYAKDFRTEPIPILGYSLVDSTMSSQLYLDAIKSPQDEIASLAVQQALYMINHPNAQKRVSLLKGTLRMHRYDLN